MVLLRRRADRRADRPERRWSSRFTRGEARAAKDFLRWEAMAAVDTPNHAGLIDRLLDRESDGATISGVFTEHEAAAAVERLGAAPLLHFPFGSLLGISLGMIDSEEPDRSRYLDDAQSSRAVCEEAFGFDPHDRVASVMAPLAPGRSLVAVEENGRSYKAGHVRWWKPGGGGLPAHVGNEFHTNREDTDLAHLATVARVEDHLSYFVVLQPPQGGGALSVYDQLWDEDRERGAWGFAERDDHDFDDVLARQFSPRAGDLVLFGGGWRWHRVDPVTGDTHRITYGGFCAPSLDGDAILFWA